MEKILLSLSSFSSERKSSNPLTLRSIKNKQTTKENELNRKGSPKGSAYFSKGGARTIVNERANKNPPTNDGSAGGTICKK